MTSITVSFDEKIDFDTVCLKIKSLFPNARIEEVDESQDDFDNLFLACINTADIWDDVEDDEVWNDI